MHTALSFPPSQFPPCLPQLEVWRVNHWLRSPPKHPALGIRQREITEGANELMWVLYMGVILWRGQKATEKLRTGGRKGGCPHGKAVRALRTNTSRLRLHPRHWSCFLSKASWDLTLQGFLASPHLMFWRDGVGSQLLQRILLSQKGRSCCKGTR